MNTDNLTVNPDALLTESAAVANQWFELLKEYHQRYFEVDQASAVKPSGDRRVLYDLIVHFKGRLPSRTELSNWLANGTANPDALLTESEAAALASLSVRTLQTWRVRGGGPQFAKLGGAVRYRRADIDAWINSRLARTTGEAEARK